MSQPTEQELESALCILHNLGSHLVGNTQETDLEWLSRNLFEWSNLGAGDIKTVPWLLSCEEFNYLGLTRQAILGDGPRNWDNLTPEQQEAWQNLGRICLFILPRLAERIGHRYMEGAKVIRQEWQTVRQEVTHD